MPIICCQPRQEGSDSGQKSAEEVQIDACFLHNKPIEFICTEATCEAQNNTLLCKDCLKQHKQHRWIHKEEYFSTSMINIIEDSPNLNISLFLTHMRERIEHAIDEKMVKLFHTKVAEIKAQFQRSLTVIQEKSEVRRLRKVSTNRLNRQVMPEIKQLYDQQKQDTLKIKWISDVLEESITHVSVVFHSILKLLQYEVDEHRWDDELEMNNLKDQIYKYTESKQIRIEEKFFEFSELSTHENIRLQDNKKEAVYVHQSPSRPVAIANRALSESHNRFGFEIMRMKSVAFVFQITAIFLGVCNPDTVKVAGMRKINQLSKGAYLVSSAGWSYHHKDIKYDRKDNVGFTFGQGDKIEIEVVFDANTKGDKTQVIFRKKGRFFDSTFEMPLKLTNDQLRKLKPCVSFSAEQGAIVRIYDVI